MKVNIKDIIIKREINPRFALDAEYIEELKNNNHWPVLIVDRGMVLIDGFHRLEAARRRGDEKIELEIKDIGNDEALALAAKLNTLHGKRLTVLELARRIKLLVKEKGWSQEKLAREANISYHTVIKIEQSGIKNPRIETVIKLADTLNVSLDKLVGREGF